MPGFELHSTTWTLGSSATRGAADAADLPGLPQEFLTPQSAVADEVVVTPPPAATRGDRAAEPLDFSYEVGPNQTAVVAIRQPSGALTFHRAAESRSRAAESNTLRFVISVPPSVARPTRGLASSAIKAIVITVAKSAADRIASAALAQLAATVERTAWEKNGLTEGWMKVTREGLASGTLTPEVPRTKERTLLLLHGTFSHAAAAFKGLAASTFFDRISPLYADRVYAFNHFTVSKTPEQNARELLAALPASSRVPFDVVTHSRGGLVLRTLVEGAAALGTSSARFTLGRAVLVASPNEGTPLATPARWQDTVGWLANLLEILPDNPLTTGAAFVANGIVWLARHASGDLPGLRSMDAAGDVITSLQRPPGPKADAYSALVANYQPLGRLLDRLIDAGFDGFFDGANDLVVPSSGGWRVDRQEAPAIPAARIACFGPGGNLKATDVTHAGFFSRPEAIDFIVASLSGKSTGLTPVNPDTALPDRRLFRTARAAGALRDGGMSDRPSRDGGATHREAHTLKITVANGDLTFEDLPLLLGHYRSTRLTGTESVMNGLLNDTLQRSLEVGLYPVEAGSQHIFENNTIAPDDPTRTPRPAAVIIVGLGSEGKLSAEDLALSIRHAILAWAQRQAERAQKNGDGAGRVKGFSLAATLIGSGGTGVNAAQSARSIVQGALDANELLLGMEGTPAWPALDQLRLVELYMDRAGEAWRALKMDDDATPGRFALDATIESRVGALPRALESGYRGVDYDFVTAIAQQVSGGDPEIAYTLDTKRARTEVRAQKTQTRLLKELVLKGANSRNTDEQIGRTLFGLLVPIEMEPYLAGSDALQLELDNSTAGFPWELLDNNDPNDYFDAHGRRQVSSTARPWAIRCKLLRKLRTVDFRATVSDAGSDASILVIGEPECPTEYPRLPGARREARAVCECLSAPAALDPASVVSLISADDGVGPGAMTIMNALRQREWRIVHIAGHGALPSPTNGPGGVVLSNGAFLSATEIRAFRTVPELVFVNCCHLGAHDVNQLLSPEAAARVAYDRGMFAAGVAEELIKIGVRCVIAAGWAVDDVAASRFAVTFYQRLLAGERFIDAVAEARIAAFEEGGNTWAAYQCYGDPDWTLRRSAPDAQRPDTTGEEFVFVASPAGLLLALDTIAIETRYQKQRRPKAKQLERLRILDKRFANVWPDHGAIAERFAIAYGEVGDLDRALSWYERALEANDGSASIHAAEQLANLRVRRAREAVDAAAKAGKTGSARRAAKAGKGRKAGRTLKAAGASAEQRALRAAFDASRRALTDGMAMLDTLVKLKPTMERLSLYGSAYKRLAMLEAEAGKHEDELRAIKNMQTRYREAVAIGEKTGASTFFYPALNALAAEAALRAGDPSWRGYDRGFIARIRANLDARCGHDPDFWTIVGQTELVIYEAVARRNVAEKLPDILAAYDDVNGRIEAKWMWGSVRDTAAFVLSKYRARVGAKREQKAVDDLLSRLDRLAK